MLISVKQKVKFTAGAQVFETPAGPDGKAVLNTPFEAPDWIIHDPYFWQLKNHGEAVSPLEEHPMGNNALLTVYGEQPSIPVSNLGFKNPLTEPSLPDPVESPATPIAPPPAAPSVPSVPVLDPNATSAGDAGSDTLPTGKGKKAN